MNDLVPKIDIDPLSLTKREKERYIDNVAKLCGYRYLYHFLKYPEADPIKISKDVLEGFELMISETNILPFRRLIHGIRRF